jgi:thiamine kinase-like enzyme
VTKIAKRMGELNIGPKLYDVFVTTDADDIVVIIKVFEVIDGKQWADTIWETPKAKAAAIDKLDSMIKKMNKMGVIHHDIHPGNVMVSTSGAIYIIDFDMAANVENEETRALGYFNESRNIWKPKGAASVEGVDYIFDKLIEEGSIVLDKPKSNTKTNTKTNNKRKTQKAAKATKTKKA